MESGKGGIRVVVVSICEIRSVVLRSRSHSLSKDDYEIEEVFSVRDEG